MFGKLEFDYFFFTTANIKLSKSGRALVMPVSITSKLFLSNSLLNVLNETILQEPVNAVIAVGTGEDMKQHPNYLPDNLVRPQFVGKPIIGNGYIITPEGERLTYTSVKTFTATAYNNQDLNCTEYNYIGTLCRVGAIAVDPTVIPYGTRMFIVTKDGKYVYGIATAEDCGSAIKGNRLDLYFDTQEECFRFGIRECKVYFLG